MTIGRDRWQQHLKTRGAYYHDQAAAAESLHGSHPDVGAGTVAICLHALADLLESARTLRLTRNQHVLFRLGELCAWAEVADCFARKAAQATDRSLDPKADARFTPEALAVLSRIFARDAAMKVAEDGLRWVRGAPQSQDQDFSALEQGLRLSDVRDAQAGLIADMDVAADFVYQRNDKGE
jgi:alkylation response protein AidB-like acyl-CoA dehydrogenase